MPRSRRCSALAGSDSRRALHSSLFPTPVAQPCAALPQGHQRGQTLVARLRPPMRPGRPLLRSPHMLRGGGTHEGVWRRCGRGQTAQRATPAVRSVGGIGAREAGAQPRRHDSARTRQCGSRDPGTRASPGGHGRPSSPLILAFLDYCIDRLHSFQGYAVVSFPIE